MNGDRPPSDRTPGERPAGDRPAADRPAGERAGDGPAGDRPAGDRPAAEREERDGQRRLERLWPELIRRFVEAGYEKLSEGPENLRQFVHELKLPKELLALILTQLEETKYGLYRVVAKEIRDVLEHSNLSDELSRALTQVTLEIRTQVRFVLNDESSRKGEKPDLRAELHIHRNENPAQNPSAPGSTAADDRREPRTPNRENQS